MVFCAYCGKSFTRKEHLERHIPSHTNVKPHRCSACQLSFARRDLLQRHHSTYHEARDPMEPLPGGVPTIAGRTPIACQNCASAKTGCDKRVPCSRCAEKNLPCAARFARRSSKAAARAAQASAAIKNDQSASGLSVPQPSSMPVALIMEVEGNDLLSSRIPGKEPPDSEPVASVDLTVQTTTITPQEKTASEQGQFSPMEYPSPFQAKVDLMSDFLPYGNNEFAAAEPCYSDLLIWPEYSMDLASSDLYANAMSMPSDMAMPTFSDFSDICSSSETTTTATYSSRGSVHTRGTSIVSMPEHEPIKAMDDMRNSNNNNICIITKSAVIPEFQVVIAAENSWPLARCNPPTFSASCPRTAIVHLEALEQRCKQDETWDSLERYLTQSHSREKTPQSPYVVLITSRTRDKMTAITQSFLHKALGVHRSSGPCTSSSSFGQPGYASPGGGVSSSSSSSSSSFNFIMLPPNEVLEHFLHNYARSLAEYYPMAHGMRVDVNEMLQSHHNPASTLLVLLMIAQGAANMPMEEARYLSAGLTETSRISLFDIIEKEIELSADSVALRCALLCTRLGAWSGDKWQMDIAVGQRGMYLSMLKHAGMLEPQSSMIPTLHDSTSTELQWKAWMHRESQNRLVYNWVMADLELSLFHDTNPLLSTSELRCPLPGPEILWLAPNAEQWLAGIQSLYGCTTNVSPHLLTTTPSSLLTPSLCDLFQAFLHDNIVARHHTNLSHQQMRLLLHPLQSLLCHLRQLLACFSDITSPHRAAAAGPRVPTKASTHQRLEEVQALLQRWYDLAASLQQAEPHCTASKCNLVLYHLLSLNAVTSFPEIEALARRDGVEAGGPTYWELGLRHKRCIYRREEAIYHCGQVLRWLRGLRPGEEQPSWWSAALYRVTLVLWADGMGRLDPSFRTTVSHRQVSARTSDCGSPGVLSLSAGKVAVDRLSPEDPALVGYLWRGEGVAVVTGLDGSLVGLDEPLDVLHLGMKIIEGGVSTRIGDGIRRKLATLASNWSLDSINIGSGVVM
ncbi:hypothetical protein M406DRAFT_48150 [Cryphonectria parasitica EP155]|uniref:Transcription factor Pig1p n=1 Tax=Cryphonectria parasitica (strain ATCC 38755 / EP155) TaxID=660469 RepID=A0A9P5CKA1_CRYP1|nr:uncharacterized protein M406DRAFT_48150 [Cryphonectria parasitica EP155]KAF3760535.1 hypothetical protein M406DRAFT_48150 [Cryphonectria parasitica EP155]